jgi:ferredoxin-type protein NapH
MQSLFALIWLAPFVQRLHTICSPVFHCYSCPLALFACPIGVMANFSALHIVPFIALGTLLVVGGAVGAFVCGWACPFGFLQDLAAKVPLPKLRLPSWTGNLRYVVLIGLVLLIPFFFKEGHPLFICAVCPAGGLEGAVPNVVQQAVAGKAIPWPGPVKLGVIAGFVLAIFVTYRPWCSLFCPLGAIYGLFNRTSVFFLRFHPDRCVSCKACHKMCKYGVKPDERASDPRCIRCLACTRCAALTVGAGITLDSELKHPPP